ncbi:MAG: serine dehydratase beta chain [Pseudomonadales bacterium]
MNVSAFDLSNIGVDSSRIQTIGPMRAAYVFATELSHSGVLEHVVRVCVELFGSLGLTGKCHGTDKAVLLGLLGEEPERIDPSDAADLVSDVLDGGVLSLLQLHDLRFETLRDVVFHQRQSLHGHDNGMRFRAFNEEGEAVHQRVYYSTGGGAIVEEAFLQDH